MAEVLKFKPKTIPTPEYVWDHNCEAGAQTFHLHRDGSVQCASCDRIIPELYWGVHPLQEIINGN